MEKESELSRSLSPIAFVYWHSAKLILSFPVGKRSAVVAVSDVVVNTAKKIASSPEFVGEIRFREFAKLVI